MGAEASWIAIRDFSDQEMSNESHGEDELVEAQGEPAEEAWDVLAPFLLHPRRIGPILLGR